MFYYIQKYQWFFYLTLIVVLLLILITIFLKHIVKIRTAELEKQNIIIINKNELLIESKENLESKLEEIEKQKKYIEYIASTDFLTKLPNRRSFIRELNKILSDNKAGVFILLDIDNFKNINDTMGHIFGDQVLISVSKILKEVEEENRYIYVARFGGDEFLILYKNIISEIRIKKFMEEFMNIFDKKIEIDNLYVNIDFSIGISKFPYDSNDENQLLTNADLALNDVKKSGKNNYKFFDDKMKEIINKKISIEFIIRSAIEEDGFKILYQPQVDIKTGKIKSYEALIRLKKYNISPAEFIPICEENGMIIEVDRIVTHKVIKQLSLWKEKFKELKTVSINYSGKQLQDYGYYDFLCSELQKYDIDPKYIEIEITENIFLEKEGITNIFLNKIRNLGIEISIDDFGTGYSSLNYLISLPISKVKIDKSLINKFLEKDFSKTRDVVKSLIYLCRNLDLKVVAEGVEYIEQFNHLNKSGCDYIQGYFFSKPKEAKEIEEDYYINYLDEMNIDFELDSEERL